VYASRSALALSAALVLLSSAAGAQMRVASVPAGMCRVWIDGQPADRQPAPTDCATARSRAALLPHARVIYGSNTNRGVNQSTDPRYDPRSGSGYDPRYDARSAQQRDPRYDSRNGTRNDSRYDSRSDREREQLSRKADKERDKAQRKQQKAWEKAHKRDGDDRDHDRRDRDRDHDDRNDRGR
jgi:hypothetical protein